MQITDLNGALILGAIGQAVTAIIYFVRLDSKSSQALAQLQELSVKVENFNERLHAIDLRVTRLESLAVNSNPQSC